VARGGRSCGSGEEWHNNIMGGDVMSTFAEDIEQAAGGAERIEAVVIGPFGLGSIDDDDDLYGQRDDQKIPRDKLGRVLSWREARPLLDYDYDAGFGAPDCHAVYVWTADEVLWVTQYDGATAIDSAPRNPRDCIPYMPGGG